MIIAALDRRGKNATGAVARVLNELHTEYSGSYGVATSTTCRVKKDLDILQSRSIKSATVIGYTVPVNLQKGSQSAKVENATLVLTGRIYSSNRIGSTLEFIVNRLKRNHTEFETLFDEVEGDYAFFIAETERIIAGRDPIGAQPLYYGINRDIAAMASNRKGLWKLGIEKTQSFPPGHLAVVTREGFKFKPVKTFSYSKQPKPTTMNEAARTLQKLLESSVHKRVRGLKGVAVAFSGGLDSSIVAYLAKKSGVNVQLMHVSLKNQNETEEAKRAADELKLPLKVHLFREEDVERTVGKVVELIEEADPVKAAVGVPFYWAANKTADIGVKALLAGQGADELFGGYQRYINEYLAQGKQKVTRTMFGDAVRLHENNIERDVKICAFYNVELRLPFAAYGIADFALSLPLELKIEMKADSLRKLVLRKAAENMGLPETITKKPKKAVQYSTGVNNALKRIAKRKNVTVREFLNELFLKSAQFG